MRRFKIISILICLLSVVPCMGATIIVDANTANPSADFNNIQAAISDPCTNDGDVIVVNPGTYTGADNRDLDFLGKAITLMSTNPNDPDIVAATIIDCEGWGRGFFFHNNEDANSIVDGFTITNGTASYGGGMYNYNSSPTVRNCVFSGNISNNGGGMYNYYNSCPTVANCTFINNSASLTGGGGVYNNDSSPAITNCTFINNSANQYGGGIHNYNDPDGSYNSSPMVTNCMFIGNSSNKYGGGMCNYNNSNPTVANCTFSGNQAVFHGGGVANFASSPEIINCILWDNYPVEIGNLSGSVSIVTCSDIKGIAVYPGEGNINLDPLFVDPDANDYHLLSDSPCIDMGDPCGDYTGQTDIDGEPRVFGNYVDMGSDEAWPVDILTFINEVVSEQTLWGTGPGKSAKGRLGALRNMVEMADNLIEAELFEEGCQQLLDAYRRTDGEPVPPDFVSGSAAPELAGMIEDLMLDLGCE